MVSLWPWRRDESSPASFEKTLSALSIKIKNAVSKSETLRQRSRRFNALWILYSSFAYLLYTIIVVLVMGWENWGLVEVVVVVGGPFLIYAVRFGLMKYYRYRTSKAETYLEELQEQRDKTIEKLKDATKYNTTQELLKKYGDLPTPNKKSGVVNAEPKPRDGNARILGVGKTASIPPPTANIPRKPGEGSFSPQPPLPPLAENASFGAIQLEVAQGKPSTALQSSAEFARNAFPAAALQYAQPDQGAQWYDRLMDVLLGEDESLPRNRLALICKKCRLVNGQAPPGAKRPKDVGKWRCFGCGTMNGDETEASKIFTTVKEEVKAEVERTLSEERKLPVTLTGERIDELENDVADEKNDSEETDVTQYSGDEVDGPAQWETIQPECVVNEPEAPKRKVGRPKGSKKKPKNS